MSTPTPLCPALAVFGTASDVGKSLITAGLCRILSDSGYRTAPYKAQNMSNNSAVTREGGEIGRAQIVQAWAARAEPHVDMNPVLLKPGGEDGSQVVIFGQPWKNRDAKTYFSETFVVGKFAFDALARLRAQYECVVMEGAGSCAEVNLRSREFVNFPAAHAADAKVVLVADIERGGVFAQIIGSLAVMPPEDRARVVGFIVNRFRGNMELFDDGVRYLEETTGLPVFGVVPYVHHMGIDSEDSLRLDARLDPPSFEKSDDAVRVAVLRLPHISNATDFDALIGLDCVELHFLSRSRSLSGYDLVILPGSKNVRSDLDWLFKVGWGTRLHEYHQRNGRLGGICGGYQMMGEHLHDPDGIEGPPGRSAGLGYLPIDTTLRQRKVLGNRKGTWSRFGVEVSGYEIHVGHSSATSTDSCWASAVVNMTALDENEAQESIDGLVHADGHLFGTYLHGLFDSPEFLRHFLADLRPDLSERFDRAIEERSTLRERSLAAWADHIRAHVDVQHLFKSIGIELP